MKTKILLYLFILLTNTVAYSLEKLLLKKKSSNSLLLNANKKLTLVKNSLVKLKTGTHQKRKLLKKKKNKTEDRILAKIIKPTEMPSLNSDINELNRDIKKLEEKESQQKMQLEIQNSLQEKKKTEEKDRQLKIKIKEKQKSSKIKIESKEKKVRKMLLRKFNTLDTKEQINKLKSIYASYGIKMSSLSNSDLKYLMKNTKRLLKMYYDPSGLGGERSLDDGSLSENQNESNRQRSHSDQQRGLEGMSPAMMLAKGSGDSIYANRAAGGDMSVKFPDSPPVVVTNQTPYYSN